MPMRHKSLEPRHVENRDQISMRRRQEPDGFLQKWEKFPLKLPPVCG
jgi:hypothetical protein